MAMASMRKSAASVVQRTGSSGAPQYGQSKLLLSGSPNPSPRVNAVPYGSPCWSFRKAAFERATVFLRLPPELRDVASRGAVPWFRAARKQGADRRVSSVAVVQGATCVVRVLCASGLGRQARVYYRHLTEGQDRVLRPAGIGTTEGSVSLSTFH